jgi:hypothetical protein
MSKLTEDSPLLWNGQAGRQKPKRKGRRLLNLSKVNLDSNHALAERLVTADVYPVEVAFLTGLRTDRARPERSLSDRCGSPNYTHDSSLAPALGFCALVVLESMTTISRQGSFGSLCLLSPPMIDGLVCMRCVRVHTSAALRLLVLRWIWSLR